jgi:hypothetical protein
MAEGVKEPKKTYSAALYSETVTSRAVSSGHAWLVDTGAWHLLCHFPRT